MIIHFFRKTAQKGVAVNNTNVVNSLVPASAFKKRLAVVTIIFRSSL